MNGKDKRRHLYGRNCTTATAARRYKQRKQEANTARQGQTRNSSRVNGWPHVDGIGHRRGAFAIAGSARLTYKFFLGIMRPGVQWLVYS